jgi:hypothetical protein
VKLRTHRLSDNLIGTAHFDMYIFVCRYLFLYL